MYQLLDLGFSITEYLTKI